MTELYDWEYPSPGSTPEEQLKFWERAYDLQQVRLGQASRMMRMRRRARRREVLREQVRLDIIDRNLGKIRFFTSEPS